MSVASLVLGIISIVCAVFLTGFQWVGAIVGLIGIILGAKGRSDPENKSMATAGLVCSIIGFILCVILYVACVAIVGGMASLGASMYY